MELLIIIILILISIEIFYLDSKIKKLLNKQNKEEQKEFKRVHNSVSKTDFGNILNGRTDVYNKYKNKDGLYEPIQGKSGINLNKGDNARWEK